MADVKARGTRMTIADVARHAGVSTQTVSRVINHRHDVSDSTRRHVEQIIENLGYRPNASARALSSRRSRTLGVVAAKLDSYGPATTLHGIETMADSLGYSLLLELITEDFELDQGSDLLDELVSLQVDGVVWMVPATEENRLWFESRLVSPEVPVVFVDSRADSALPHVSGDGRIGGRLAAEHLLDCGYHRIGIITGPMTWASARQRLEGWRDVLGVDDPDLVYEGDWTSPSGAEGMRALIERVADLDAVFASNDQMALGAMHHLHSIGRAIPDDIGVVGYDATPESAFYWPPLTTIEQPLEEQGARAVARLYQILDTSPGRVERSHETLAEWLAPTLISRQSTCTADPNGLDRATDDSLVEPVTEEKQRQALTQGKGNGE